MSDYLYVGAADRHLLGLGAAATAVAPTPGRNYALQTAAKIDMMNRQLATALRPAHPAIDRLPLPAARRQKLKDRPLDALMEIFGPIEDRVRRVVDKVNRDTGSKVVMRPAGRPAVTVDTRMDDPRDAAIPRSTRVWVKRMRLINNLLMQIVGHPLLTPKAIAQVFGEDVNSLVGFVNSLPRPPGAPNLPLPPGTPPPPPVSAAALSALTGAAAFLVDRMARAPQIVDSDRQMPDVFLVKDQHIAKLNQAKGGASSKVQSALSNAVNSLTALSNNTNRLVGLRDGYRGPGGAPRLAYLAAEWARMARPTPIQTANLGFYGLEGILEGVLGEAVAAGTATAGAASATTTSATTGGASGAATVGTGVVVANEASPSIAEMLLQIVLNAQQDGTAKEAIRTGTDLAGDAMDTKNALAGDRPPPDAPAEAIQTYNEKVQSGEAKKASGGDNTLLLVGGLVIGGLILSKIVK